MGNVLQNTGGNTLKALAGGGFGSVGDSLGISAVSGIMSESNAITVSGTAFGTKALGTPLYFSDFSGDTIGATAIAAGLDDLGNDGKGFPLVASDRSKSGGKSLRMDYLTAQDSMFPRVGVDFTTGVDEVFMSQWVYWSRYAGTGGSSFIFKLVRGGANPPYSGIPRFYETVRPDDAGVATKEGDAGSVAESGGTTYATGDNAFLGGPNRDGWHKLDYQYKLSSAGGSDGVFREWIDGGLKRELTGLSNRTNGATKIDHVMSVFDGNDSYGVSNGYYLYCDNIHIDSTLQRVEIGNASTYAACTEWYVQPASVWSSTSITFAANLSGLTGTAYVYIFDAAGNVNSTGFAKVIS